MQDLINRLIEKIEIEEKLIEKNESGSEKDLIYINEHFGRLQAYSDVIDMLDVKAS